MTNWVCSTSRRCRWNTEGELSSSDAFVRTAKPPWVWDHLDRRERQFITPHCGKDKPHLMKQPGQSCIKSHRTVSCSAICTPPLSPQWVSGTADATQLVEEWVHFRWWPGLLVRSIVTSDEWYRCCEIWHISGLHHHVQKHSWQQINSHRLDNKSPHCMCSHCRDLWLVSAVFHHPCFRYAPSNRDESNLGLRFC